MKKKGGRHTPKQIEQAPVPVGWGDEPRMTLHARVVSSMSLSFHERKNVYVCRDGHEFVTIDRHPGVTPMIKACIDCGDTAISQGYSVYVAHEPRAEWYRPSSTELRRLNAEARHHVNQGGLLFRGLASAVRE